MLVNLFKMEVRAREGGEHRKLEEQLSDVYVREQRKPEE